MLSPPWLWVQFPVGERRFRKPSGAAKKKEKQKNTQNTENTESYIGNTAQNLVIDRRIHSKDCVATVLGNVSMGQAHWLHASQPFLHKMAHAAFVPHAGINDQARLLEAQGYQMGPLATPGPAQPAQGLEGLVSSVDLNPFRAYPCPMRCTSKHIGWKLSFTDRFRQG